MGGIIFLVIICLCVFFKTVPSGTVVIIDRNGHYLKTVKFGIYFFCPFTDKITTEISKQTCSKTYTEIFETYDSQSIKLSYTVRYRTDNIDDTLKALSDSRRSIYDVINCSVYNVIKNANYNNFKDSQNIISMIKTKAKFDIDSLNFILVDMSNFIFSPSTEYEKEKQFKPHISSSRGPIKYY